MQFQQKVALLAETKLFDKLDEAWLAKLADWAGCQVCEAGQTIFVQEELGDRLFIIVEGVVKLLVRSRSGDSIELLRQTRPAVLGELAVLDGGRRSASAEAVEPTTLLYLTGPELFAVMEAQPQVAKALLQRLAGVVRRTTEDLTALAFLDLEGRVARRILALSDGRSRPQLAPTAARNRRITQQEIGQMVSGSRQRVNVALRSLERKGFIALTESGIEIRDGGGLQQRADQ
jgi:CRP/FNR family transcriptional regulator, cyclic AMP receptor protein